MQLSALAGSLLAGEFSTGVDRKLDKGGKGAGNSIAKLQKPGRGYARLDGFLAVHGPLSAVAERGSAEDALGKKQPHPL